MSQYPASGVLFANDRKQNDKQPDYTGNLEIDVETVRDLYQQMQNGGDHPKVNLAGWRKTSKNGKTFLSVKASVLRERQQNSGSSYQAPPQNNNIDDEIPFLGATLTMLIPKQNKVRDENYLKTLRGSPCLVCRRGAEAHHLQRGEQRGVGYRTGDNWAVPLCHDCHMKLHQFGDEQTWWDLEGVDPIEWAKRNWEKYNG